MATIKQLRVSELRRGLLVLVAGAQEGGLWNNQVTKLVSRGEFSPGWRYLVGVEEFPMIPDSSNLVFAGDIHVLVQPNSTVVKTKRWPSLEKLERQYAQHLESMPEKVLEGDWRAAPSSDLPPNRVAAHAVAWATPAVAGSVLALSAMTSFNAPAIAIWAIVAGVVAATFGLHRFGTFRRTRYASKKHRRATLLIRWSLDESHSLIPKIRVQEIAQKCDLEPDDVYEIASVMRLDVADHGIVENGRREQVVRSEVRKKLGQILTKIQPEEPRIRVADALDCMDIHASEEADGDWIEQELEAAIEEARTTGPYRRR